MNQVPEAVFVVERRPGQGYGVTSSWGPRAQALLSAAVEVLNELCQPDPRGPEEVQRWVPAAGPQQQPLFVRIRRTPEGESVYHQAWFPANAGVAPERGASSGSRWWLLLGLVLFLGGAVAGWAGRGPGPGPQPLPSEPKEQPSAVTPRPEPERPVGTAAELVVPVRKAREACKKLGGFLSEPSLSGWPGESDTIEPTVELRDFRKTPRGVKIEPAYLTNDEVRSLRKLLEVLDGVK